MLQGEMSKGIVTGTIVSCLIFGCAMYVPILGFLCSFALPLPMVFYRVKIGRQNAAVVLIVSTLVVNALLGRMTVDIVFFSGLMVLGFVLGECLMSGFSLEKTVLYTVGGILGAGFALLVVHAGMAGKSLDVLVSDYIRQQAQLTLDFYKDMGLEGENLHQLTQMLQVFQKVVVRILPAMVTVLVMFITWTSLLLARPLLRTRGLFFPDFGPLNRWKAPEVLVWGVIACGVVLLIPAAPLKTIGGNALLVFMMIYFFQGIAIVAYFFEAKGFPRFLKIFVYCIIAMQQLLLLVVIGVGFFDTWLNFRKLSAEENG